MKNEPAEYFVKRVIAPEYLLPQNIRCSKCKKAAAQCVCERIAAAAEGI